MTSGIVVSEAIIFWLTAAAAVGWGIAIPACLAWLEAERSRTRTWKMYERCSEERRALVNGAPVQLMNVCRNCRALLREHNS